jgi:hypothetical protein
MKKAIAMIFMLAHFEVWGTELVVKKMTRSQGYSDRYDLKTTSSEKVILDCQSFIQGLLFGENGQNAIFLQEWECEELVQDMKKTFSRYKKHCLEIDFERGVLDTQHTCD